jgi:CRISPR/Cas system-associated endonuclease Cas1
MTSGFHDGRAVHQKELQKFLSGVAVNPENLRRAYHTTNDPRIRDLCRMLMKTTKVKHIEDLAGEEGNLNGLLIRRNARILATKFKQKDQIEAIQIKLEK